MKKIFIEIAYWIGCFLIGFAKFITGLRSTLFIMIAISIVMGIAAITMIGFADLVSPDIKMLGSVYWDIVVIVLGGATMWLGYSKMMKFDEKPKR